VASVELQFPPAISNHSAGGPGYRTSIVELDSGAEERVGFWSAPRYHYNLQYGIRNFADLRTVLNFYVARRGPAVAFRYKDWLDYSSSATGKPSSSTPVNTDQQIGVGNASQTAFQLVKNYADAGATVVRTVTKPVTGSVTISFDGVDQPSGWTVDTTTGIVTFSVAPGNGVVVKAGYLFDVPVRFGGEIDAGLLLALDTFDAGSLPSIPLVEVIGETPSAEDKPPGGSAAVSLAASASFTRATGELLVVTPTTGGFNYTQSEPETGLGLGGPYHRIVNASGSFSFTLKGQLGGTIVSVAAGATYEMWIKDGGAGTKQWAAFP
jgi:uncharacterized protein (TIGR02217 family)